MTYAEVILPLPLQSTFTYAIPAELTEVIQPGMRVIVPFGRKKHYTGIVASLTRMKPEGFEVKEITMLLDHEPTLRHPQIKLWQWVSDYYMCGIGDVYKAAVPAGLKLESETFVEINDDFEEDANSPLTEPEALVTQFLDHEGKHVRISDIEKKTGLKRVSSIISGLLEKGAVIITERLVERYRSRKVTYVRPAFNSVDDRHKAFEAVKGARKQEAALLALLTLTKETDEIPQSQLMERADVSSAIINAMVAKGIIEKYKKEINRWIYDGKVEGELPSLTDSQADALDRIHQSWMDHSITLLHGVTSSGKTEIYLHLMEYVLRQGRQVLLLVPEIALTTQLTHRVQRVFGDKVLVYHSKFSDNQRVDLWKRLRQSNGEPLIIIGARSSVFLPFDHLGLVIVDEEQDPSYKQQEPAPRYNGRDTAILLASMHGAKTLLGSATPSVETYYKAREGKYGLVEILERFENLPLPTVELVDMKKARQRGAVQQSLSSTARQHIADAVESGKQAIVFINHRGYAPIARCTVCGHTPRCAHCDVALTYHRGADRLICHYCGSSYPLPVQCPACKEPAIEIVGYGTERVEENMSLYFPDARIARMDLDTTRSKDSYSNIIDEFSQHKKDILVGTQMVTKGLDFDLVKSVTILNADGIINYPDFRSSERAFTMLEQVAGRAGRKESGATVTVQAYDTSSPIFDFVLEHDYNAFYNYELLQRREFYYPPFCRLIYIYLKHPDKRVVSDVARQYSEYLRAMLGSRVHGPDEPPVSRVQSLYIRRIMVKAEPTASMPRLKMLLREAREALLVNPDVRATNIYYDVDPV